MASLSDADKKRIAKQFSRAASHYDEFAAVQLDIAFDALAMLPAQCRTLLDIGCGTGRITRRLQQRSEQVVALDLALGMLQHAQTQQDADTQPAFWIQGDAENLPLATGSVDTLFSSMVLQWCRSPQQVMREIDRVLRGGGQCALAIMCQGSFSELSQSWASQDQQRHVNQFHPLRTWQQAALNTGLHIEHEQRQYQTWHPSLRDLLHSIKAIGANVLLSEQSQVVQTARAIKRHTLQQLEQYYFAEFGHNQRIPLSYQVIFVKGVKQQGVN